MRLIFSSFLIIINFHCFSQSITLNEDNIYRDLRLQQLNSEFSGEESFVIRPISYTKYQNDYSNYPLKLYQNKSQNIDIKFLPVNFNFEYNSDIPYKNNNGSMLPNRGFQSLVSFGFSGKLSFLTFQIKPEYLYRQNLHYNGFWEGHYPIIWVKRYNLWNWIDMPERFGIESENAVFLGQSNFKFNFNGMSLGVSNENIWWGPSIRNSIMMSNNSRGFNHITFNSTRPHKTFLGNFEWQFITGKLIGSGFTPPRTDFEYGGNNLYIPKRSQTGNVNDWRYLQGYVLTFSPKFLDGLNIGIIRWATMYSELVEGKYTWLEGKPNYFPVFENIFRNKDQYENYEAQTDQAGGIFFRWLSKKSALEVYGELYYNDTKQNIRDLLLDTNHARAFTIGFQKILDTKSKSKYSLSWEWTKLEQTGGRLLRSAGSWYHHSWVNHGYTNYGEVLGAAIGPGSNSQYLSILRKKENNLMGLGFEIIDNNNDFYYYAFEDAQDARRYWKDFNLHLNFEKKFNKINLSSNFVYSRSLNYQWELVDDLLPYYHPGKDLNNIHFDLKILYLFN